VDSVSPQPEKLKKKTTQNMKEASSSETSVPIDQTARNLIPEDRALNIHFHAHFIFHIEIKAYFFYPEDGCGSFFKKTYFPDCMASHSIILYPQRTSDLI
jgi:hypothetical protein